MTEHNPEYREPQDSDYKNYKPSPRFMRIIFGDDVQGYEEWLKAKKPFVSEGQNDEQYDQELDDLDDDNEPPYEVEYDLEEDKELWSDDATPEGWENWLKDPDTDEDAWDMPDSWYE